MDPFSQLNNQPYYHPGHHQGRHCCILLHGLGGGVYELGPLANDLRQAGFSVAASNYPGHQINQRWMPDSTWHEWYDHQLEDLQKYRTQYDTLTLIGFSTGCPLSVALAQAVDVDHLIWLSPFFRIRSPQFFPGAVEPWIEKVSALLPQIPRKGLPINDITRRREAEAVPTMRSFNLKAVHSALGLIETVTPTLQHIHQPVLMIQSYGDTVVCPLGARQAFDRVGSPDKELLWLQDSDHVIVLDKESPMVSQGILDFLERHTPAVSGGSSQGQPTGSNF